MKIGIFDSSIGGMVVAASIIKQLPTVSIVYYGDTAWFPYNDKSYIDIVSRSIHALEILTSKNCPCIIIACNTATAVLRPQMVQKYHRKAQLNNVYNLTLSTISDLISSPKKIGVIGTTHTIKSCMYEKGLQTILPKTEITQLATPNLAKLAEEYCINPQIDLTILYEYLSSDTLRDIDALVLGCTHYYVFIDVINTFYQKKVAIIDSIQPTINFTQTLSEQKQWGYYKPEPPLVLCSKVTKDFETTARLFLGNNINIASI